MEQNFNYYKIFYKTAELGNISKAANALYISQPAVSKSINKLEQSLGHTLFIRNKKGVKLTEEGSILYHYLKEAFQSIDVAEKTLQRIGQFGIRHLRIGVSTSLCKHILLSYLQDFIKENPHIKVSIECNPTYETVELLKQGKIDIGLICDTPLEKGYHFTPLRSIQDTFVTTQTYLNNLILRESNTDLRKETNCFSPKNKPITSKNESKEDDFLPSIPNVTGLFLFSEGKTTNADPFPFNEKELLEKANLMLLDKENISRIFINNYFEEHHINPGQILEINNMDLLIDFAAIGMGIACVVREFVSNYLENGQVIEIPLDFEIPKRIIGFISPDQNINATAKKFLEFCIS